MNPLAQRIVLPFALLAALACEDGGLEPIPFQGISGTLSFFGLRPDSTDWVRIGVYAKVPAETSDFLDVVAFSDTLFSDTTDFPYFVGLEPGVYLYIVAFWKPLNRPLTQLRVGGWYTFGSPPFDVPAPAIVEPDSATAGIDLVMDLGALLTLDEAVAILEEGS